MALKLFENYGCLVISDHEKCVATHIFFLDSNGSCQDLLFPLVITFAKNTSVLGHTILKVTENLLFGHCLV